MPKSLCCPFCQMENISTEDTEDTEGTDKDEDKGKKQLLEKNLFPTGKVLVVRTHHAGSLYRFCCLEHPGCREKIANRDLICLTVKGYFLSGIFKINAMPISKKAQEKGR